MQLKVFERKNNKLVIPVPERLADCIELIKSDQFRKKGERVSLSSIIKQMVFHPFASTLIWFRLSNYGKSKLRYYPFRLMYRISCVYHNINIPISTMIGYGLYIGHGNSIVINDKCVIGNNVNISHFVTIGSNYNTPPTILDNVYIGPNACIIEDVIIGQNSIIGAGTVVTKDIEANCTAIGVPGRILNRINHNFIQNPWIIK